MVKELGDVAGGIATAARRRDHGSSHVRIAKTIVVTTMILSMEGWEGNQFGRWYNPWFFAHMVKRGGRGEAL